MHLSPRQLKILEGIAAGKKRAVIADELGLSIHTVNGYIEKLYLKLGCHTGAEALAKYIRLKEPQLELWAA